MAPQQSESDNSANSPHSETTDQTKSARAILKLIEYGGLFIITVATLVAGAQEIFRIVSEMRVTLSDLLLLFIYLEVVAMVAVYLDSGKLPVRMPIYIAMVALARYLALDVKALTAWDIIAVAIAIILLAGAVFLIRFGELRFPYPTAVHRKANQKDQAN